MNAVNYREPAITGSRRRARTTVLLCAVLAAWPAFANPIGMTTPDRWQPHEKVGLLDNVTLRMHWHDDVEALRAAAIAHDVSVVDLHGFSILRRNTATGEWFCDVFVVRMRGALVDNDRTVTFGHEVLHCVGLRHAE